jgi:hypothetical protein
VIETLSSIQILEVNLQRQYSTVIFGCQAITRQRVKQDFREKSDVEECIQAQNSMLWHQPDRNLNALTK